MNSEYKESFSLKDYREMITGKAVELAEVKDIQEIVSAGSNKLGAITALKEKLESEFTESLEELNSMDRPAMTSPAFSVAKEIVELLWV